MIKTFLKSAKQGNPVYISTVHQAFAELQSFQTIHCMLSLIEDGLVRYFPIKIPYFQESEEEDQFIREYVWAEIYNILSCLGGRKMDIYIDRTNTPLLEFVESIPEVFHIHQSRQERQGYGCSINVIDRILETLTPDSGGFQFIIQSASQLPRNYRDFLTPVMGSSVTGIDRYIQSTENLDDQVICGIDVGGTDIKIVLVKYGEILCYKEYDWYPTRFTTSQELINPILLVVRLMRAVATADSFSSDLDGEQFSQMRRQALSLKASHDEMERFILKVESLCDNNFTHINAVGICFPDVVIQNKIVGGEVYKTRGIREAQGSAYEDDFRRLTHLNDSIRELLSEDGRVSIINDGPMASFTAALELAVSGEKDSIQAGVFAHTLGTELGAGWVDKDGSIPDIPLEVYNCIIDLGSYPERAFHPDDIRSINNFNTDLPGTLQKYISQSGVFRLALKYLPEERPDLLDELEEKGFITQSMNNKQAVYTVPIEPQDMRKPFLEHMMKLVDRENDETVSRIWKDIGEFLAITWLETDRILQPAVKERVLFGRLVKSVSCFHLMQEGAQSIKQDLLLSVADASLAHTRLMKSLGKHPYFTVAQFAQAIGAVYFTNSSK